MQRFFFIFMRNKSFILKSSLVLSLLAFFFSSCVSNHDIIPAGSYDEREESLYIPEEIIWEKIDGISFAEYFFYENKAYPVRYHCVKIDLTYPSLKILTYPQSEADFTQKKGKVMDYFPGLRGGKFSQQYNSLITMNTAPFSGKNGKWDTIAKITSTRRICGIHIVEAKELAPPIERYSALTLTRTESGFIGKIIKNQKEDAFKDCDFAFGGFFTILTDGEKESFNWRSNDSRSAIGLSKDGKTIYLLAVEGERWSKSHGLTYPECADVLLALGASNAMEMDGGDSTVLFINKKNMLSYPALRKNAVFIGFSE